MFWYRTNRNKLDPRIYAEAHLTPGQLIARWTVLRGSEDDLSMDAMAATEMPWVRWWRNHFHELPPQNEGNGWWYLPQHDIEVALEAA